MVEMPLHTTDGDEAAFLFADIVRAIGILRELSERMAGGERLATRSINKKVSVVSID